MQQSQNSVSVNLTHKLHYSNRRTINAVTEFEGHAVILTHDHLATQRILTM